jgi:uncharacterized protein
MDVSGSYTFGAPRDQVWAVLLDPEAIRAALPGCEEMRPLGDDVYEAVMTVGIGSIKGTYTGKISVRDKEQPLRYRLLVEGAGRPGFVKGDGLLDLEDRGDTTVVAYKGTLQVGGMIAGVAQRLLPATVTLLSGQFFKAMERQIGRNT